MEIFYRLVTIWIISYCVQGANDDTKERKWFLLHDYLFHIESMSKFISNEAQQYCIDNNMYDIIQSKELAGLSKYLISNYDFETSLWLLDEKFSYSPSGNASIGKCYALSATGTSSQICSSLKGVICKQKIFGGSLQYQNGSHLEIAASDVSYYCDRQSDEYEKVLIYCLIKLSDQL